MRAKVQRAQGVDRDLRVEAEALEANGLDLLALVVDNVNLRAMSSARRAQRATDRGGRHDGGQRQGRMGYRRAAPDFISARRAPDLDLFSSPLHHRALEPCRAPPGPPERRATTRSSSSSTRTRLMQNTGAYQHRAGARSRGRVATGMRLTPMCAELLSPSRVPNLTIYPVRLSLIPKPRAVSSSSRRISRMNSRVQTTMRMTCKMSPRTCSHEPQ